MDCSVDYFGYQTTSNIQPVLLQHHFQQVAISGTTLLSMSSHFCHHTFLHPLTKQLFLVPYFYQAASFAVTLLHPLDKQPCLPSHKQPVLLSHFASFELVAILLPHLFQRAARSGAS
jgi:hypothetical protein